MYSKYKAYCDIYPCRQIRSAKRVFSSQIFSMLDHLGVVLSTPKENPPVAVYPLRSGQKRNTMKLTLFWYQKRQLAIHFQHENRYGSITQPPLPLSKTRVSAIVKDFYKLHKSFTNSIKTNTFDLVEVAAHE